MYTKIKFLRENKEVVGKIIYDSLNNYFISNFENPENINELYHYFEFSNGGIIEVFKTLGKENISLYKEKDSIFIYWYGLDKTDNQCKKRIFFIFIFQKVIILLVVAKHLHIVMI